MLIMIIYDEFQYFIGKHNWFEIEDILIKSFLKKHWTYLFSIFFIDWIHILSDETVCFSC